MPFDDTLGALLIGFTVSTFLLGISATQLYLYVINFPDDRRWIKILVWAVWIPELTHFVAVAHSVYGALVTHFGDALHLLQMPTGFHVTSMSGAYVSLVVKFFFIFRIWSFSKSYLLTAGLSFLALASTGTYLAANSFAIIDDRVLVFTSRWTWLIITCCSLSAAGDVAISLSLIWILKMETKQGSRRASTTRMVEQIIIWTLETSLLTSGFNVGMAVSVGVNSRNYIWLGFWFCLCRCYANSMLATLNGRSKLRKMDTGTETFSLPSTSLGFSNRSYPSGHAAEETSHSGRLKESIPFSVDADEGHQLRQ